VVSVGMTFVIIGGGIDLSVGALVALSSVWASTLATQQLAENVHWIVMVITALLVGAIAGLVNGLVIAYGKLAAFIATLAMLAAARGLAEIISDRRTQIVQSQGFLDFFSGDVFGVPTLVIIFALVAIAGWVLLNRTTFGRRTFAVGGNAEAARLAGARVRRFQFGAYAASGLLAAVAGIILASRLRQGDVTAGDSALLDAVAMTLVGYAVLGAKKPNALGTVVGAIFIGLILQGLTQLGLPYYTQDLIKGLVLIFALLMSFSLRRRRRRAG
jgi:ribose transport system permease protein